MTTMEMLKRQPRGMVSHDALIEIAEEAGRKHVGTGEQVADLLINACRYGVLWASAWNAPAANAASSKQFHIEPAQSGRVF